ncbi:histidine--tRNA ligase [Alterileibacterium massiliense]|uniref:histidine--tRNA ligase n=1 Tax=Alterileibacterium massiliense TaxID=1870997 RepID=UPI0008D9DDFC|nr:histidine--tRNA ligase [Alterileibacterium massiliense]
MNIKAPKGTKDILPADSYKWQFIEDNFSKMAREFGYGEIRTPMFENTALFKRSVGETSDIVQKEMYTFNDMGKRSLTLKPEGTSPAVRAFSCSTDVRAIKPHKYYYDIPCFRYENTQEGRYREFHQFGVEIFGSDSMLSDAEVIALADSFLRKMGIDDLELRINSVGCKECRPVYRKALQDYLMPNFYKLSDDSKKRFETNPMRILDSKEECDKELVENAPTILDYLCDDCRKAFTDIKLLLDEMNIAYIVDSGIVRGLDYYTKTAFEFISKRLGSQGTVCGGGRYDHLVKEIGGQDLTGVGFGMGKERLLMLMSENGHNFGGIYKPDYFVAFVSDEARLYAINLVNALRNSGKSAIIDVCERKLKSQMKLADKVDAKYSIIIGEDEINSNKLTIKDMTTGNQIKVDRNELLRV